MGSQIGLKRLNITAHRRHIPTDGKSGEAVSS
jgi:hypothetical protein